MNHTMITAAIVTILATLVAGSGAFTTTTIKLELEPIETEEIGDEEEKDNTAKQEEEREEEEEESDDDIAGTGLEEEDNITIDDNYSSDDDVPFDLPFDNMIPFP